MQKITSEFESQIDQAAKDLAAGKILNNQLQSVQKYGFRWTWHCLYNCFVTLLTCRKPDPFAIYRTNNIARGLLNLCEKNAAHLTPELKQKIITQLLEPLNQKTKGKYDLDPVIDGIYEISPMEALIVTPETRERVSSALNLIIHELFKSLSIHHDQSICISHLSLMVILGLIIRGKADFIRESLFDYWYLKWISEEDFHDSIHQIVQYGEKMQEVTNQNMLTSPFIASEICIKDSNASLVSWFEAEKGCERAHQVILKSTFTFTGSWAFCFDHKEFIDFTCVDQSVKVVEMLSVTGHFPYAANENFRMVEMPLKTEEGNHLSQIIILPVEENFRFSENDISLEEILAARNQALVTPLSVFFPSIQPHTKLDLLPHLAYVGIPAIDPLKRIDEKLQLQQIMHETSVILEAEVIAKQIEPDVNRVSFCANRPYQYLILSGETILVRGNVKHV